MSIFKTTLTLLKIIKKNRDNSIIFSFRNFLDILYLRPGEKHSAYSYLLWKKVFSVIPRLQRIYQRYKTKNMHLIHIFLLLYRRKYSNIQIFKTLKSTNDVLCIGMSMLHGLKSLVNPLQWSELRFTLIYMHVYGMSLCEMLFFKANI